MKAVSKSRTGMVLVSTLFLLTFAALASAEEYEALQGVDSVKTVFDFRDGKPESALVHLKLAHETYKDKAVRAITDKPAFAVVFMDSSVKLLSKNREGFSAEERKMLDEMDQVISAMSKDGIQLEVCLYAVKYFDVDPESIAPEIHRVDNGWISSMGYQAQGYSLVPAF